jgi:TonB family protein
MEKILFFVFVISISTWNGFGQNTPNISSTEEVDISVIPEIRPQFPDGDAALFKYLYDELRYPNDAKKAGITGKVIVTFVIQKDGTVEDVKVVRGISPSCDAEAIRIVRQMPTWSPGSLDGKPVNVKYTLPITFKL